MCEPGVIKKLDESVVNRIAAGEVIQRAANALKELLENSLDANSTNIQVTAKNGGLKLLQIQDNGTGIRKDDLPILCERFTTSKLREFDDLNNISTFGFRGEALASISYVAHLTVTTKTSKERCAFKASYEDGRLTGPPIPCAGNQGTLITVEDLFYNVSTRRNAIANVSEEMAKIVEVVSRYAIHNPTVGFSMKKHGDVTMSVKTNQGSTHIDNIRSIFGEKLAKDLLKVSETDETLKFKLQGFVSNANYSAKKQVLILFINDRLVGSSALKRSLENMYVRYLPKNEHAFAYLGLSIDPRNVDVNVHPTKHEVHFLHEEAIIEKTIKAIERQLLGANDSRIFYTQAKLPGINLDIENAVLEKTFENKTEPKVAPKSTVRVDSTVQKIDRFLSTIPDPQKGETMAVESKKSSYQRRDIKLSSILSLRKDAESSCNLAVRELVSKSSFIGCVDGNRCLGQNGSALYLFNVRTLKEELIYQIMLYEFGNFGAIRLQDPIPLLELALLGLEDPVAGWQANDGPKGAIAESVVELLESKKEMLLDYFSVEIEDGELLSIPLLLDDYQPDMSRLPHYILRLACDVDWSAETPCFQSICRETAKFFAYPNVYIDQGEKDWAWTTEHVIFPAIKKTLLPPKSYVEDQTIIQLTTTEQLYKIFERC